MRDLQQEPSVGDLLGRLTQDLGLLVRQEVQLAKIEMRTELARFARSLVSLGGGGLLIWLGALSLTASVILLLVRLVGADPWIAALCVGAVLIIAGYALLHSGLGILKHIDPTPRRTVESVKEDIQWVKEQRS